MEEAGLSALLNLTASSPMEIFGHSQAPHFEAFSPFVLTGTALIGCSESFSNDMSMLERGAYVIFAIISMITSLSVAVTIFYNEKLRLHPSKLIAYMCVCEGASCFSALIWVIDPRNYICYFGIHYLWRWTTK